MHPKQEVLLPVVIGVLEDSDPSVVLPALDTLSEAGETVVPALIKALENEKARYWACVVLAGMGPTAKSAVPALAEALTDPQPEIRMQAAIALGEIGPAAKPAVPALAERLNDKQRSVQYGAVFAIGRIGDPSATKALSAFTNSDDPFLNMISTWAVAKINPTDKQLVETAVKTLMAGLQSEQPSVRQGAARALFELQAPAEVVGPELMKVLTDKDPQVVAEAVDALASLGAKVVPSTLQSLKNPDLAIISARILGRIGPDAQQATPALASALSSQNAEFRHEAAYALARIGPGAAAAVPALIQAVGHEDFQTSVAAVYAIGSLGPAAKSAAPAIKQRLEAENFVVRVTAAWALVQVEPESKEVLGVAIPILAQGLSHEREFVRIHAATALGQIGPAAREAIPALEAAQDDPRGAVRSAAGRALERMVRKE